MWGSNKRTEVHLYFCFFGPKKKLLILLNFKNQENAAGERVRHLIHNEWHSNETFFPIKRLAKISTRVFYGKYDINLYYDSELMWKHTVEHSPTSENSYVLYVENPLDPQPDVTSS